MIKVLKNSFLYHYFRTVLDLIEIKIWTKNDIQRLNFYKNIISQNDLVFDIGANIGNRTKLFNRLQAKVIAIEPQAYCFNLLTKIYGNKKNIKLIHTAIGNEIGDVEMSVSNAHTISSLSEKWINAVKSNRFSEFDWNKKELVSITTLDKIIEKFGAPKFIKIDVEGYEDKVISGLSVPIDLISLEFTPEYLKPIENSLLHLSKIYKFEINYTLGESLEFELDSWVDEHKILEILNSFKNNGNIFGDIYIKRKKVI